MSYEVLKAMSDHLAQSRFPQYKKGGEALIAMAGTLLEGGYIPFDDGTILIFSDEAHFVEPMHHALDFSFDRNTGELFKDGVLTGKLTKKEKDLLGLLVTHQGEVLRPRFITRELYDVVDDSRLESIKVFLNRTRKQLPVEKKRSFEILQSFRGVGVRYNHFDPPVEK